MVQNSRQLVDSHRERTDRIHSLVKTICARQFALPLRATEMYAIVLATQKGGSGKSTLAIGLAIAAMDDGHRVWRD